MGEEQSHGYFCSKRGGLGPLQGNFSGAPGMEAFLNFGRPGSSRPPADPSTTMSWR